MKAITIQHATLPMALLSVLTILAATPAHADTITRFAYDAGNHVVSVTDPRGLVTTYTYDGLGQRWRQASPDTGVTSYSYDGYGRLASFTRADGAQTAYAYDGIGRRVSISAGGATQSFTYDNCSNGVGRLCRVEDGGGTVTYTYSPEGRVTGRGFNIGGTGYALGYSYNALGQVTGIAYPDGNQALYTYINGAVSSVAVKINGGLYTVVGGVGYQPGGGVMASWASSSGLINTLGYDTDGRLTRIDAPGVQSLSFNYDPANRIVGIVNGIDGGMTQNFGYDDMSRLVSVYSGLDNQAFAYDTNGNRTYHALNGAGITVNPKSNNNQISGLSGSANVNYGYDPRGNLTSISGVGTFTYDAFNRLSAAPNANYYVGPEGQRLRKTVGGANTWFAPDASGALMAEATNGWTDYVWLNGRLIGRINGGQYLNIHTDQVGRPEAMTDGNRNVVWRARNFAFDRQVTINHAVPLNLGFPGQYYDAETGLWNNGFRDYSPSLGRYIQSDPIGLAGGANTYAYVNGNPISFIDLLGLLQQLSYTTVSGGPSSQSWSVKWSLSEPSASGGWVVQTVNGTLPNGSSVTYSEAWQVGAGDSATMASQFYPADDTFSGWKSVTASAAFYEGLDLPDSFQDGDGGVPYAGQLRSKYGKSGLSDCGATNFVNRQFSPTGVH